MLVAFLRCSFSSLEICPNTSFVSISIIKPAHPEASCSAAFPVHRHSNDRTHILFWDRCDPVSLPPSKRSPKKKLPARGGNSATLAAYHAIFTVRYIVHALLVDDSPKMKYTVRETVPNEVLELLPRGVCVA